MKIRVLAFAATAALASACAGYGGGGEAMTKLAGTTWEVASIDGVAAVAGMGERKAEVAFVDETRVSFSGGCNRFMGGYEQHAGDAISFGSGEGSQFASTMMACPDKAGEQDEALSKAIMASQKVKQNGDMLTLLDKGGKARVVLRKAGV